MNTTALRASRTTVALRDGTRIDIRPLRNGEQAPVLEVFEGLSARSRYLRFLAPVRELSPQLLGHLTRLNERDRLAFVASSGTRAVGEVRFVRLPDRPDTADLALSVVDDLQRRGLGSTLLRTAAAAAFERDVSAFLLTIHPENRASLGLARSVGARLRIADGLYEGRVPVAGLLPRIPLPRAA